MSSSPPSSPSRPPTPGLYRLLLRLLGPAEKRLGITCRDFIELSSERHECSLGPRKQTRYLLHWLVCALCRKQERRLEQLNRLTSEVVAAAGTDPEVTLPAEARERIRERVAQEIAHKDPGAS
jgi:hypothetical protein